MPRKKKPTVQEKLFALMDENLKDLMQDDTGGYRFLSPTAGDVEISCYFEDFIDEDTGDIVSIFRCEINELCFTREEGKPVKLVGLPEKPRAQKKFYERGIALFEAFNEHVTEIGGIAEFKKRLEKPKHKYEE